MSWQQTHERWLVLRKIEAAVAADPHAPLAWRPSYAELFGDRAGLVAFLRYRWRLRLSEPDLLELSDLARPEHPARRLARVGLAALDLQGADRAVA